MSKYSSSEAPPHGQPQRRDIAARQDLLGRELRKLFDGYTHEDVPDALLRLAEQLEGAFSGQSGQPVPSGGALVTPQGSQSEARHADAKPAEVANSGGVDGHKPSS